MDEIAEVLRTTAPLAGDAPVDRITARAAVLHGQAVRRHRLTFTVIVGVLLIATVGLVPRVFTTGPLRRVAQDVATDLPSRRTDDPGPVGMLVGLQGPAVLGEGVVSTGEYAGEPLLVHVWAPWCGVCVHQDLPELATYAADPDAVRVVTVAVQSGADAAAEALGSVWPDGDGLLLEDTAALDGLLADLSGWSVAQALPVTVAVSADGRAVAVQEGSATTEIFRQMGDAARDGAAPAALIPGPSATLVPTEMPGARVCEQPSPGPDVRVYPVQPGDSLASIAEEVYGDPSLFGTIAAANGLTSGRSCPYSMLIIPPTPEASVDVPSGNTVYEVRPGDTLSIIAERVYGDPAAFGPIAQANNLTGSTPLRVGQQLLIPIDPSQ